MRLGLMTGYSGAKMGLDMEMKESKVGTFIVGTAQIEAVRLLAELNG